jgi:hypothetical protein
MEWLLGILIVIGICIVLFTCKVSGQCSKEEEYRNLDPKVLDDDTKEWNIEEEYPYDETFVKKEK